MSDDTRDASFLNRWSKRKQQTHESPSIDQQDSTEPVVPLTATDASELPLANTAEPANVGPAATQGLETSVPDSPEEILLSDEDMPPIESLTASSDVSAFFNKGVSVALRKAALRFVFQQPEFNVRDGLNDYDGDYTVFEPLGDTITSDMKFHAARKERNRLEAEAAEEEAAEKLRQESANDANAEEKVDEHDEAQAPSDDESTDTDTPSESDEPSEQNPEEESEPAALELATQQDSIETPIASKLDTKETTEPV